MLRKHLSIDGGEVVSTNNYPEFGNRIYKKILVGTSEDFCAEPEIFELSPNVLSKPGMCDKCHAELNIEAKLLGADGILNNDENVYVIVPTREIYVSDDFNV